jgi:polyphosphate glucokinase
MLNDADLQGVGVVQGKGVEVVITLGTGFGTAIFEGGKLGPHLEFAHHPFRKGETYNEQVGDAARKRVGPSRWNKRVERAIATLRTLTLFDHLSVGGGNVKHLTLTLAGDVTTIDSNAGILGGVWLWDPRPPAAPQ